MRFFLRVLIVQDSFGASGVEAAEERGESVAVTKHGFESRWGHQLDFVDV
jgi:hypothetical protein